ncbi:hypothetical protein K1719_003029 [Acacia pycnantha]|nr:hypothetical protein K1719_003029 [Acacia pycnantha]
MNWITRNLTWTSRETKTPNPQSPSNPEGENEDQLYGITEDLINCAKSFTIDTFKNFPLQVYKVVNFDISTICHHE